ncbi:pyridoxal phosphate-dependent aminotransferase [Melghiribacillus thermohalophilus]|uniref:pyridoxal phosphate-dependent aminotransferase n=1 Tax=Melghiribacillus thermohalophilus TaxID=1324956 RepID=UPI0010510E7F|nr:pyridoxal phosphate-dependent aminotransferase [Melghiribacillus thermohalophilus]
MFRKGVSPLDFEISQSLKHLPEQFFARLASDVQQYVQKGYDVINLGQGNPDQPTPEHIVQAMQEAVAKPEYHKYSPFGGQPFLKEAICEFYRREYGVHLDPEKEVAILIGAKHGLVELPRALLNPGDMVLVPDPGYPDYWSGIALARARMERMPLTKENEYLPDYDSIPETVKHLARMMFLNYPNNPTGATASPAFFKETVRFASENQICVVHDFAYGAIGFDGIKPPSFLETDGAKEVGIEVYTLSKTYNMAGWRIAFAAGNKRVIGALNLLQDHLHCSVFSAIQEAARVALTGSQQCVKELRQMYEKRRNRFIEAAKDIGWHADAPKGSFFAWLPVPDGYTSESFSREVLDKAHVAFAPGNGFGEHGEGFVRAGLLTTENRMKEAVQRIKDLEIF